MKTYAQLLSLLLILLTSAVSAQTAGLEIVAPDSSRFTLSLNGDVQSGTHVNTIRVEGLRSTRQRVLINFENDSIEDVSTSLTLTKGKIFSYQLKPKAGTATYRLVLDAEYTIAPVDESASTSSTPTAAGVGGSETETLDVSLTDQDSVAAANDSVFVANYTGARGCASPVASSEFMALDEALANSMFEFEKMEAVRKRLPNQCLTVDQVKVVLQHFEFEDNRVEVAKMAYQHTFDIGNFEEVLDLFILNSSKEAVQAFIAQ